MELNVFFLFSQGQGEQFYDYNHGAYAAPHKAPEYSPPIKVPAYPAQLRCILLFTNAVS